MKEPYEARSGEPMIFYPSFREAIDSLPTDAERLAAYDILTDYGIFGEDPGQDIQGALKLIFLLAKPNIDLAKIRRENGRKGGRPVGTDVHVPEESTETAGKQQKKTNGKTIGKNHRLAEGLSIPIYDKDKDKDVDRDTDKDIPILHSLSYKDPADGALPGSADAPGARPQSFTWEQVQEAAREIGCQLLPDQLRDFYQWMEKYNWQIKGAAVNLKNALRGYERKHAPQTAARKDKAIAAEEARQKTVDHLVKLIQAPLPTGQKVPARYQKILDKYNFDPQDVRAIGIAYSHFPESMSISEYPAEWYKKTLTKPEVEELYNEAYFTIWPD